MNLFICKITEYLKVRIQFCLIRIANFTKGDNATGKITLANALLNFGCVSSVTACEEAESSSMGVGSTLNARKTKLKRL